MVFDSLAAHLCEVHFGPYCYACSLAFQTVCPLKTMKSLLITSASPAQKWQFQTKAFVVEHDVTAKTEIE
jgi:hypothetical protein